jgi:hypothetical protein
MLLAEHRLVARQEEEPVQHAGSMFLARGVGERIDWNTGTRISAFGHEL